MAAARIDAGDAKIVRTWLRWQVLPRLRRRAETGASTAHSLNNARRALRAVLALLETVHRDGHTLATLTQADVDRWFAQPTGTCWLARGFLSWARDRRHLPRTVTIPPAPPKVLRLPLDHEERWAIARRLVTNDTILAGDRVAAVLLVLYGQPLTRIARLARDDIRRSGDGTVLAILGGTPVPIHEPFATLITQLPARRTNGVAGQIEGRWLFPGRHAGRPVGPLILASRLRALGISPAAIRSTARAQLVAEIPPAMLGELIGIGATTANRWATIANGTWLAYAATQPGQACGQRVQGDGSLPCASGAVTTAADPQPTSPPRTAARPPVPMSGGVSPARRPGVRWARAASTDGGRGRAVEAEASYRFHDGLPARSADPCG
ncbi:MAG TPA: hypothetical protein VMV92_07195 [Streptosporangiaceae bacterium]|nr:hypothetical protein [Streptosporangiaceae bacterium]HVB44676.1 hypothetical protein [Streptosporangiaceae bacterium]